MIDFPPGPHGLMVSFDTWQKFIRASNGSDAMKQQVIDFIYENVHDKGLLDSFKLGYALGVFSNGLTTTEHEDWFNTVILTRDMNNVPIVNYI